jgi:hypothetical protein
MGNSCVGGKACRAPHTHTMYVMVLRSIAYIAMRVYMNYIHNYASVYELYT